MSMLAPIRAAILELLEAELGTATVTYMNRPVDGPLELQDGHRVVCVFSNLLVESAESADYQEATTTIRVLLPFEAITDVLDDRASNALEAAGEQLQELLGAAQVQPDVAQGGLTWYWRVVELRFDYAGWWVEAEVRSFGRNLFPSTS